MEYNDLFIKRHQQILSKKNSIASNIKQRNAKHGQVIGDSKAARLTDLDHFAYQTIDAKAALKELMGARSDDMNAKAEMYEAINSEGFVQQQEIESKPEEKTVLKTIDALWLSAGLKSDIINESLILKISADMPNE